jgi:hypothetical protein
MKRLGNVCLLQPAVPRQCSDCEVINWSATAGPEESDSCGPNAALFLESLLRRVLEWNGLSVLH